MGTIEVPIFYGEDPEKWVGWIDEFSSARCFSDFETRQFAYGFIEGDAFAWYCEELSRSVFRSWGDLKLRLLQRFSKTEEKALSFQDRMKELNLRLERLEQRWKEKEDAKKSQEEKKFASDNSRQIIENDGGRDDLILYSNPLIPEVKNDMLILDYPVLVQEKDDPETESLVFKEDNCLETEMDDCACQVFDQMPKRKKKVTKKKKRWKKLFPEIEDQLVKILSYEEIDNSDMLGIQMENTTKRQRQRWVEWSKGSCHWVHTRQRLARKWLLLFRNKEIKREMLRKMTRYWHCHVKNDAVENKKKKAVVEMTVHNSQELDRQLLLLNFTEKKKKKTKLEKHEKKLTKANKYGDHIRNLRETKNEKGKIRRLQQKFVKLLRRHKRALKKLEKWKERKYKQMYIRLKEMIRLNGLRKLNLEVLLAADTRMTTVSSGKRVVHEKPLLLVTLEWIKFLLKRKKIKVTKLKRCNVGDKASMETTQLLVMRHELLPIFRKKRIKMSDLEKFIVAMIRKRKKKRWREIEKKKRTSVEKNKRLGMKLELEYVHLIREHTNLKKLEYRRKHKFRQKQREMIMLKSLVTSSVTNTKMMTGRKGQPMVNAMVVGVLKVETKQYCLWRRTKFKRKHLQGKIKLWEVRKEKRTDLLHEWLLSTVCGRRGIGSRMKLQGSRTLVVVMLSRTTRERWNKNIKEMMESAWPLTDDTHNGYETKGRIDPCQSKELKLKECKWDEHCLENQHISRESVENPWFLVFTKEIFHFLRPPEQNNTTPYSPGSTLPIPFLVVSDNDSLWNSRWDGTSHVLMAFCSSERETSTWTHVVIDFHCEKGGTSLQNIQEIVQKMTSCRLAVEQWIFPNLSVTTMEGSSEVGYVDEFQMGNVTVDLVDRTQCLTVNLIDGFLSKEEVMRMKLQLVGLVALLMVSVEVLFHFTRPPEMHQISVDKSLSREEEC